MPLTTAQKREVARIARQEAELLIAPLRTLVGRLGSANAKGNGALSRSESTSALSPKAIKAIRRNLGISAADFASLAGTSAQSVYNWESGTAPRPEKLKAILALRDLSPEKIQAKLRALARA